jgi:hypothetical protein
MYLWKVYILHACTNDLINKVNHTNFIVKLFKGSFSLVITLLLEEIIHDSV